MANSEMSMESIDTGSNYSFGDKMIKPNAPKAAFDLTHLSTMDIYNAGIMFPVCSPIETVMGDDFDINVKSLLRVLPQKVPLYSRQRLYIYAFYCRNSDLWSNWNVFARKGNLGKTIKEIPTLNYKQRTASSVVVREKNVDYTSQAKVTVNSLADYLGHPIGLNYITWNEKINALPFFMYLKIWRDYFCNKNIYAGNKILFPDNDDEFRLGDDGNVISAKNAGNTVKYSMCDTTATLKGIVATPAPSADVTSDNITVGLFYHDWPDDRFTDALPWPQRGTEPALNVTTEYNPDPESTVINSKMSPVRLYTDGGSGPDVARDPYNVGLLQYRNDNNNYTDMLWGLFSNDWGDSAEVNFNKNVNTNFSGKSEKESDSMYMGVKVTDIAERLNAIRQTGYALTLNKIRELAIEQTELEKMARTDGTYMGFAMTFFGEAPKNAEDYRPVYIGGTYTDIQFSEVLNTTAPAEAGDAALGKYAGHGIAGNNDGYIGHIHCDDYGWIMILGCIMPDVYYCQGLAKQWTRKFQSDIYLPERAKMGMIPLLNHEIYALNTDVNNMGLFAWNNPFDELRYRANEIHGQIADSTKEDFFHYTQARLFSTTPSWGKNFSEASDIDMDYLAGGSSESAYTAQFKIELKAIRPVPYKAIPASII